jgi:hypothetical protein
VELVSANKDAAKVFQLIRSQTLDKLHMESAGMGGMIAYSRPFDLNHLAVWAMIDAMGIKDRLDCFRRVIGVFHEWLSKQEW